MEVHVTPETAKKLNDLATTSGRAPEDIVEDALAGYLEEVASVRKTLDSRYDDLKSGRVKPVDGEEVFRRLRARREAALGRGGVPRPPKSPTNGGNSSRARMSRARA